MKRPKSDGSLTSRYPAGGDVRGRSVSAPTGTASARSSRKELDGEEARGAGGTGSSGSRVSDSSTPIPDELRQLLEESTFVERVRYDDCDFDGDEGEEALAAAQALAAMPPPVPAAQVVVPVPDERAFVHAADALDHRNGHLPCNRGADCNICQVGPGIEIIAAADQAAQVPLGPQQDGRLFPEAGGDAAPDIHDPHPLLGIPDVIAFFAFTFTILMSSLTIAALLDPLKLVDVIIDALRCDTEFIIINSVDAIKNVAWAHQRANGELLGRVFAKSYSTYDGRPAVIAVRHVSGEFAGSGGLLVLYVHPDVKIPDVILKRQARISQYWSYTRSGERAKGLAHAAKTLPAEFVEAARVCADSNIKPGGISHKAPLWSIDQLTTEEKREDLPAASDGGKAVAYRPTVAAATSPLNRQIYHRLGRPVLELAMKNPGQIGTVHTLATYEGEQCALEIGLGVFASKAEVLAKRTELFSELPLAAYPPSSVPRERVQYAPRARLLDGLQPKNTIGSMAFGDLLGPFSGALSYGVIHRPDGTSVLVALGGYWRPRPIEPTSASGIATALSSVGSIRFGMKPDTNEKSGYQFACNLRSPKKTLTASAEESLLIFPHVAAAFVPIPLLYLHRSHLRELAQIIIKLPGFFIEEGAAAIYLVLLGLHLALSPADKAAIAAKAPSATIAADTYRTVAEQHRAAAAANPLHGMAAIEAVSQTAPPDMRVASRLRARLNGRLPNLML